MAVTVSDWLHNLGFEQYTELFAEHAIDMALLPDISDSDLKEIGIHALGHRKTLLQAIDALRDTDNHPQHRPVPVHGIAHQPSMSNDDVSLWSRTPGERKPVTLLFADIVGSTALTEKLDAEEAHDLLYPVTRHMCQAVESHAGTVCRLMGDGVMAMFGAPVASERHALEGCLAALAMQAKVEAYAQELGGSDHSHIQIRVGLHSGEVVVLEVGDDPMNPEFDASGPAVPLAARMEQCAQAGTILITENTRQLAGILVDSEVQPPVKAKGFSEPVNAHRLLHVRLASETSPVESHPSIVGRKSELAQFKGLLEASLESGNGHTILLRGEAGIGKSRLAEELTRLAIAKGFIAHKILVLDFGAGKGQEAMPALTRSLLGIKSGSNREQRKLALQHAENIGIVDSSHRIYLNDLLDLNQPLEFRIQYDAMKAEARSKARRDTIADIVTRLAQRKRIVLIVEDLQWADKVTLDSLARLSEAASEAPVLLVMTSRAEGDPIDTTWRARAGEIPIVTWDLNPLRESESQMLGSRYSNIDDALVQRCIRRAAGNPLFLEQLLLSINNDGDETIPDSIKSLVLARMDQLPTIHKQALRAAAVLGQRFELELLRHIIDDSDYQCEELVEHHLIRPEGEFYLFSHALIQGGAYASMIRAQRVELHLRAADLYADRDRVLYAEHLDQAGDSRAPGAYLEAARFQSQHYRLERSLQLVQRAIEIASPQDSFELYCFAGNLYKILWQLPASKTSYRKALEVAENDIQRCQAWVGLAASLAVINAYDELIDLLEQAEVVATTNQFALELAKIHQIRGGAHFFRGQIEACLESNIASLKFARMADSAEVEAEALSGLGDAEYNRGRFITSYDYFNQCIKLAHKHGFGRVIAINLSMRAYVSQWQNQLQAATSDYRAAVDQAVKTHDLRAEMLALLTGGAFWSMSGNLDEGEQWLKRGLEITLQLGSNLFEGEYYYLLARVAMQREAFEQARVLARHAVTILRESKSGMTFGGPIALGIKALTLDDSKQRKQDLVEAEALLASGCVGHNYLIFYEDAMEVSLQTGDWEAVYRYAQALEDYTRDEPLPRSDYFIRRGRTLADVGNAKSNADTHHILKELLEQAYQSGFMNAVPALQRALH